MKKLFYLIALAGTLICSAQAQEPATTDEAASIPLSAYMDPSSSIPQSAQKVMIDKMQKILSKNGLVATENERFIVTANINELNVEKSETAPVVYIVTLEVNFYLGDGLDAILYSSCSTEVSGAGESKQKAYMAAVKKIKVNDPMFKAFLDKGKARILVELRRAQAAEAQRIAEEEAARAAEQAEREAREALERERQEEREAAAEAAREEAARQAPEAATNSVKTVQEKQSGKPAKAAAKAEAKPEEKTNYQVKGKWFK